MSPIVSTFQFPFILTFPRHLPSLPILSPLLFPALTRRTCRRCRPVAGASASEGEAVEGAADGSPGRMELSDSLLSPAVAEEATGQASPAAGAATFAAAAARGSDSALSSLAGPAHTVLG